MNIRIKPSRRDMLKGGGALIVSFTLAPQGFAQGATAAKPVALTEVDSYLVIDANGAVTLYSGKVDLGTGVTTALAQMAAEELDVPFARITVVQGDTTLTPEQGSTWGSLSIQVGGIQIRQASAAAKAALIDQAATRLGVKKEQLTVTDGVISGGGGSVTYGQLIGGKTFSIKLDPKQPVATKDPKEFKVVGKSVPRVDIPGKVMGTFTYMQDFRVPGMLHARVVRPPAIEAKLESVDEGSISSIPTAKVVRQANFLAVVAENEWAAVKGARMLKATWSKWEGLPEQAKLYEHVRATKVAKDEVTANVGNSADALGQGAKKLSATYDFAIHTHGSMGPSCAIAEFKDGKLTSWSASQATHNLRKQLAKMFSMKPENVRCIYFEGSGCYGRNGHEDAAADAALLAKLTAKPVRVQWSRADEHGWDPKGPPTLIDLRAALDGSGGVAGVGIGVLHSTADARRLPGAVCCGIADRHAIRRPHRAWQHLPELQHSLQVLQHQGGVPSAGDDPVPAVLDQDAGADAEHLRQRMLLGRAGGGGGRRSGRVPAQVSRPERHAGHRVPEPRRGVGQMGQAALAERQPER